MVEQGGEREKRGKRVEGREGRGAMVEGYAETLVQGSTAANEASKGDEERK